MYCMNAWMILLGKHNIFLPFVSTYKDPSSLNLLKFFTTDKLLLKRFIHHSCLNNHHNFSFFTASRYGRKLWQRHFFSTLKILFLRILSRCYVWVARILKHGKIFHTWIKFGEKYSVRSVEGRNANGFCEDTFSVEINGPTERHEEQSVYLWVDGLVISPMEGLNSCQNDNRTTTCEICGVNFSYKRLWYVDFNWNNEHLLSFMVR